MKSFKQFLNEGINDKGIFKAIFVIGLPGAGKSYTVKQMSGSVQPRIVNTDRAGEFLSQKWNKPINSETWGDFKDTAHRVTKIALSRYLDGMLPLFVDGTSNDVSNILHRIGILESLGYDVGVVFVETSLDTAIKRAEQRAKEIGRSVDEHFIRSVHEHNAENAAYLKSKVKFFKTVVNDGDELTDREMLNAFKAATQFFDSPVDNPIGKRMIEQLKERNQKYLSPELIPIAVLEKKIDGWYKS